MQGSQAANHTHDLLTQRIQLCCEILQSINWKWGRTLFRDSTSTGSYYLFSLRQLKTVIYTVFSKCKRLLTH